MKNCVVNIILIIISIACVNKIYSQEAGNTYTTKTSSSFELKIYFGKDKYILSLIETAPVVFDVIYNITLSLGNFFENDKTIILKDTNLKFTIVLEKMKDKFKISKGFKFCQNIIFELYSFPTGEFQLNEHFKMNDKNQMQTIQIPKSFDYKIKEGIYKYFWDIDQYILFKTDGRFVFYISNLEVLSGKWFKKKNIIILKDDYLKCKFKVIISNNNELTIDNLPGFIKGDTLKLEENKPLK